MSIGIMIASFATMLLLGRGVMFLLDPHGFNNQTPVASGQHCLRGMRQAHPGMIDALRERIDTDDYVEPLKTTIGTLRPDGTQDLKMTYKFRSRQGRYTEGRATAKLTNSDCSFVIKTLER